MKRGGGEGEQIKFEEKKIENKLDLVIKRRKKIGFLQLFWRKLTLKRDIL